MSAPSHLLELFRQLASFSPERVDLSGAPWEAYVDWAIGQGLAPLAAYNLEYRLVGTGAPDWARDRLMSIYQGSVNDNVMKLVHFKRTVDELEGRRILVLGGASFAEVLYPHVAFRPVLELQLAISPSDLDGFSNFLGQAQFRPTEEVEFPGAARVLSDGRTPIALLTHPIGAAFAKEEDALFQRALPMKVFGSSFFRLDLEDAICAVCLEQARNGYDVPLLTFLDLRELLRGAPDVAGPYSRPFSAESVREKAQAWRIERALYCSTEVVARLFPEVATRARSAQPTLRPGSRKALERWVVAPTCDLGRRTGFRGASKLRRLLSGGR